MSQASTWNVPTVGPGTMSQFAGRASPTNDAILTHHSGASRPSYAVAHSTWLKIVSGTAWELYLYDGTDDILIGTFNAVANTFTLQSSGLGFATSLVARTDTTPLSLAGGRIVVSAGASSEGLIELKGKSSGSYDASGLKWTNGNTAAQFFDLISNIGTGLKLRDSTSTDVMQFLATGDINSKLWGDLKDQIVQPGEIGFFPFTSAPSGWLKANGALISRTTYARLWAAAQATGKLVTEAVWSGGAYGAFSTGDLSTTFRIPSMNGYFPRGVYDEVSYTIGTYRGDANKSHNHGVTDPGHIHTTTNLRAFTTSGGAQAYQIIGGSLATNINPSVDSANTGITINNDGATEGEPRNIPFLACIKI